MKYRYIAVLWVIFAFFMTNTLACSNPLQKKSPKDGKQQSGDKEQPKDLERLISNLDELYEAISGMEKTLRTGSSDSGKGGQQEEGKTQDQGQGGEGQGGGGEDGQEGGNAGPGADQKVQASEISGAKKGGGGGNGATGKGVGQGTQGGGNQQNSGMQSQKESGKEKLEKFWRDLKDSVEKLNAGWNSFETKADEDNLDKEAVSGFEDELNNLSASVQNKDIMQSLNTSNELQKYIGEFLLPYKETVPVQLYDVRYFYQKAYIECLNSSWSTAKEELRSSLDAWHKIATDIEKEDEEIAKKMEFSLEDLRDGLDTQDLAVVETKSNVVKENFKAMEKLFKDKEKKKEEK